MKRKGDCEDRDADRKKAQMDALATQQREMRLVNAEVSQEQ